MNKGKLLADEVIVGPFELFIGVLDLFAVHDVVDHVLELLRIPETESIYNVVIELVFAVEDEQQLVVLFRPLACEHFILGFQQLLVVHHLEEYVCVHHREVVLLEAAHIRLHDRTRADSQRAVLHIRRVYVY